MGGDSYDGSRGASEYPGSECWKRQSLHSQLCGDAEEFDAVKDAGKNGFLNPLLVRNLLRKHQTREKMQRQARRDTINAKFVSEQEDRQAFVSETVEDAKEIAQRLNQRLEQTRKQRMVSDMDPQAVAARLAVELALDEKR